MWETLKNKNTRWQEVDPADRTPFDNADPVGDGQDGRPEVIAKMGTFKTMTKTFVDKSGDTGDKGTAFQVNKIDPSMKVKAVYDENMDSFDVIAESDNREILSLMEASEFGTLTDNTFRVDDVSALEPRQAAQSILSLSLIHI